MLPGVPTVILDGGINSDGGLLPSGSIAATINDGRGDRMLLVAQPEVIADLCAHLMCFVTSVYVERASR